MILINEPTKSYSFVKLEAFMALVKHWTEGG